MTCKFDSRVSVSKVGLRAALKVRALFVRFCEVGEELGRKSP